MKYKKTVILAAGICLCTQAVPMTAFGAETAAQDMERMRTETGAFGKVPVQSVGCIELFHRTYGDVLRQISLDELQIPDGFDAGSMLSSSQKAINRAYSNVSGGSEFREIWDAVTIGGIFETASRGLKTPQNPDIGLPKGTAKGESGFRAVDGKEKYLHKKDEISSAQKKDDYETAQKAYRELLIYADIKDSVLAPREGEDAEDNAEKRREAAKKYFSQGGIIDSVKDAFKEKK